MAEFQIWELSGKGTECMKVNNYLFWVICSEQIHLILF